MTKPKYLNAPFLTITSLLCSALLMVMLMVMLIVADESDKSDTAPVVERTENESTVTVHQPDRELHYVEPLRVKHGYPSRIYVEFSDSHEVVVPPCRDEDSDNCFWWAPARGNGKGESFVTVEGRVFPLQQGGE